VGEEGHLIASRVARGQLLVLLISFMDGSQMRFTDRHFGLRSKVALYYARKRGGPTSADNIKRYQLGGKLELDPSHTGREKTHSWLIVLYLYRDPTPQKLFSLASGKCGRMEGKLARWDMLRSFKFYKQGRLQALPFCFFLTQVTRWVTSSVYRVSKLVKNTCLETRQREHRRKAPSYIAGIGGQIE